MAKQDLSQEKNSYVVPYGYWKVPGQHPSLGLSESPQNPSNAPLLSQRA